MVGSSALQEGTEGQTAHRYLLGAFGGIGPLPGRFSAQGQFTRQIDLKGVTTVVLCSDCEREISPNDEQSLKYGCCFRCRALSVGVTWIGGGGYGKQNFHDGSLAQAIRENVVDGSEPRR